MSTDFEALIKELRVDYLKSFPEKIATLQKFFAEKNWPSLENEFHKIKGTGKTYGVPEMSDVCGLMENICRNKSEKIGLGFPASIEVIENIEKAYQTKTDVGLEELESYNKLREIAGPQ